MGGGHSAADRAGGVFGDVQADPRSFRIRQQSENVGMVTSYITVLWPESRRANPAVRAFVKILTDLC
ncbi:hypothetical protein ACVITL_006859 [Rhizobium pisi]